MIFWGPLAWTVIYGLLIATFLTLIVVPILFYLITLFKMWLYKDKVNNTTTQPKYEELDNSMPLALDK